MRTIVKVRVTVEDIGTLPPPAKMVAYPLSGRQPEAAGRSPRRRGGLGGALAEGAPAVLYDFHTHSFLSDGVLSPVELIRRAHVKRHPPSP